MSISDNIRLAEEISNVLTETLPIRLGPNKKNELVRLIYEICSRETVSPGEALSRAGVEELLKDGKGGIFAGVKAKLIEIRYPSMRPGDKVSLLPLSFSDAREAASTPGVWEPSTPGKHRVLKPGIDPKRIFVEESVSDARWTKTFISGFPGADVIPIKNMKEGTAKTARLSPADTYASRRDNIFIVKSKSAFVKPCPCTKKYKRCGYWILNLGFGCPFDCSYCYLQSYSNAPGTILPANIEDYLPHIEELDRKAARGTRIGTGEFTDSLALDRHTRYSCVLMPLFAKMHNLRLELKTKTADIEDVLRTGPNPNVVVAWSMNAPLMAERCERGASPVSERLSAAKEAAARGFRIAFHFDPLIYYSGWEKDYKAVVDDMFADDKVRRNTAWISLGTLRYPPGLKEAAEKRFADNGIFYDGEFFADSDGKLRYHRELRETMYRSMAGWIKAAGVTGWIYLCMEPDQMWERVFGA